MSEVVCSTHGHAGRCEQCWAERAGRARRTAFFADWNDDRYEFVHVGGECIHIKGQCYVPESVVSNFDEDETWLHWANAWPLSPASLLTRQAAIAWLAKGTYSKPHRRCLVCCPDLPEGPVPKKKHQIRLTGLGWPLDSVACARRARDIDGPGPTARRWR